MSWVEWERFLLYLFRLYTVVDLLLNAVLVARMLELYL